MSVRPCLVLLITSGMFESKSPLSGLRFKLENIAFADTRYPNHKNFVDSALAKL